MSNSSPRARASHWLQQLKPGFLRQSTPDPTPDPLRTAGKMVRDAREAKGLGLRDLAQRTRISIAVLEALEGGWKDRLPEATYLRAMLPLLEHHLDLPAGSLEPLLPHARQQTRGPAGQAGSQAAASSPSALHLLTTWQSGLLYGLLVLGLLYGVNRQQQQLAAMGRLVAQPIPLSPDRVQAQGTPQEPFPDLRPLRLAADGQAMDLLRKETRQGGPDRSLGLLSLSLAQPTQLALQSPRGGNTQLAGLSGELSIPVLPPFELRLTPPPPVSAVRWRGQTLREKGPDPSQRATSGARTTAVYAVPPPSPPKPSPPTPAPPP